MLGAIIGDIVGSRWEFNPTNDYNFELFSEKNDFTDDTICTIAVADALLHGSDDYGQFIHTWCRKYPYPKGGYGGRFAQWVASNDPQPYNSFGNGSAMRVSAIGLWFDKAERVISEAEKSAMCSHNHPEGMKGAAAVALAIFEARRGCQNLTEEADCHAKALEVANLAAKHFGYNLDMDIEAHRNRFDETCQGTVPVALYIIAHSYSFEDALRQAVSLGADADTLGAIVGSIAEHIWGIPEWMKEKAMSYLTDEMKRVVEEFYERLHRNL